MIEYLDLTIDELLLDQENPRLGAVDSQSEALEAIIKLNHSHFRALMVSIKENGLDPGDSLYVIQADDKRDYIVLEGNRRLSAMKVLVNPDILDGIEVTSAVKNSLVKVALDFNRDAIEPIRCVLFRNREEAHDWIYRRHTGAAEGEGRINWGPMEIQRFSGDRSILDVIEFVGRNADYSDDEWASTKSMIESRKSSNLARLLESAAGRKHLGIAIVKSESEIIPMLMSDPKWALGVLKHIIEDVRDGVIDSRALNKASDIANYFESLPGEFQPKSSKKALTPCAFRDIFIKGAPKEKSVAVRANTSKKTITPRPRRTLSPKRHDFMTPASTKVQRLLHEASLIDVDRYTISSAFLLRAFIEAALEEYVRKNGLSKLKDTRNGNKAELSLTQCAVMVVKHIEDSGLKSKKDLHGFRVLFIEKSAPASIESLNGFIHNKYQIPTSDSLRSGWDAAVPVFIAAFGAADVK